MMSICSLLMKWPHLGQIDNDIHSLNVIALGCNSLEVLEVVVGEITVVVVVMVVIGMGVDVVMKDIIHHLKTRIILILLLHMLQVAVPSYISIPSPPSPPPSAPPSAPRVTIVGNSTTIPNGKNNGHASSIGVTHPYNHRGSTTYSGFHNNSYRGAHCN